MSLAASASTPSSTCSNVATSSVGGNASESSAREGSPHRREVTQVHRQRPMSNRIRRHEATIEVDPVHLRVGRQDVERSAVRPMTAASSPGPTTTHEGIDTRDLMRAMSARSPMSNCVWAQWSGERTRGGRRSEKAPLCRVGRSNEPAKAGGAAVIGRASGFLGSEACTTRDPAAHLG